MWIEIYNQMLESYEAKVTPLAGVWIEIKSCILRCKQFENVTPLAGVWIEIVTVVLLFFTVSRHSPCGSVD